jgi:hypothetical protein
MRALLGIFALSIFLSAGASAQEKYSILQGSTSDSVTHFTIVAPAADQLKFEAISNNQRVPVFPSKMERVPHTDSDWVVYRLKFEGLRSTDRYVLRSLDQDNHVVDQRNFKTLVTKSGAGRIALVSCMLSQFHNPFMWNNLAKPNNRPDLMLFLGDAVYLDRDRLLIPKLPKSTLEVWNDFVRSRNKLNVYFWKDLVPVVSIWDDHDSGGDNIDARFPLMHNIRKVYDIFFANEAIPGTLELGPGLSKQFEAFGKNIIMLDGRSYRELDPESPLFGKEQEDWMIGKIKSGANLIISGSQFFGGSLKKDSLESNWPEHYKRFTERLRIEGERRNASYVFASGDIHFSEIQHIEEEIFGYPSVELTSSSAHSMIVPGYHRMLQLISRNPRQSSAVSTHNVLLMELDSAVHTFDFQVRALTWRGRMPFVEQISIGGPCEKVLLPKKVP